MESIRRLLCLACCTVAVAACAATTETTGSDDDAVTAAPACSTDAWGESRRAELETTAVAKIKHLIESEFKPRALAKIKTAFQASGMTLRDEDVSFAEGPNAIRSELQQAGTAGSTLTLFVRLPNVVVAAPDGRTRVFVTKRRADIGDADLSYSFKLGAQPKPNYNPIGNLTSYVCVYAGNERPDDEYDIFDFYNQATLGQSQTVMVINLQSRLHLDVTLDPVH